MPNMYQPSDQLKKIGVYISNHTISLLVSTDTLSHHFLGQQVACGPVKLDHEVILNQPCIIFIAKWRF